MSIRTSLSVLLLLLLQQTTAFSKEVVRITTGEWAPFVSDTLENKGLLAQLTKEAFAMTGVEAKFGFFPWVRATELSKSGEWDGTIAFVRLKEREEAYYYSDTLYTGQYVFFHLKDTPFQWNNYEDLKNITIAATRGYGGMGEKFIQAEKSGTIKVLRLTSDIQSFNMLLAGRVRVVPSDLEVGYVTLHSLYGKDSKKFTHAPKVIHKAEYHLVISKKIKNGPQLIQKFDEGLKLLHKSGRYDAILKYWYDKPIYKDAVPANYRTTEIKH